MKRLRKCCMAWLFSIITIPSFAVDIYVSSKGSDENAGSTEKPLATLSAALRKARELRRLSDASINRGIHIIIRGGFYQLYEPVFIRPEDAGTATSPTFIEATPNEKSVFSGGIQIQNWYLTKQKIVGLPFAAQGKVWVADIPLTGGQLTEFRQLWVNGVKAIRARDKNADSMYRILSWNKKEETCWIPTPKTSALKNVLDLEMYIHQWWAIAILRIRKIEEHGDSTKLFFHQPESKIESEHPWPPPWISNETGNSAFYLTNAIQFLDEPGEWYLDIADRKLYYWPRENEDMRHANAIAPMLETLIKIEGSIDHPVSNIFFKGISFQHTGWLRPSQYGHVPIQTGMYLLDAYKLKTPGTPNKPNLENQAWVGRPAAAIEVSFANHISFENCRFEHLASTGLDYNKGSQNNTIKGNLFKDIGGTAILAGVYSDEATEIHLPYNPKDEREVCDQMLISNNLITDVANEDWGCVGIGAGYVRNTTIEHNEISDVSYTGISMGWGWSPTANAMKNNKIIANKITHYGKQMYDVGGIYTLSAQPNSVIGENYIDSIYKAPYAHIPTHWFYIYTDEGSSYFMVKNNWCPSEKFLQNANGPGNIWENNGPQVSEEIKKAAGLESAYQNLLAEKILDKSWSINEEKPVIIELITGSDASFSVHKLQEVIRENKISNESVYQWNDHYMIFGKMQDVFMLKQKIISAFPHVAVKIYYEPFYEFNRKRCNDNNVAKEWDHILLTANLVANGKLQKEYLSYHATQFEKWPEVAKGFCNAGFQQLLLYRNGRQLVLVISIPKGESLDKLNPKTTENNPRMDEWNNLMKKYQEGIEGTNKGETWMLFKKL
ncbi:MAG TPA: L-rhamnose mutarotase [Chitinophagaceae bacterium]|nr:L-rhamnose mutarotase [Chitinophagaceae bacterium]